MINEIKDIMKPTLNLIKELNANIKDNNIDPDTLTKLSTTMKLSSMKIDKLLKQNKLSASGGVYVPKEELEEDE